MCFAVITQMNSLTNLNKYEERIQLKVMMYRGIIGSMLYLTTSRLDIMLFVCICAGFQYGHNQSHYLAGKSILKYLK